MNHIHLIFFMILAFFGAAPVHAQSAAVPEVEWYPPEIEKAENPEHAIVIISGRTQRGSVVSIDGDSITLLKGATPADNTRQLRANCRAYKLPDLKSPVVEIVTKGQKVPAVEHSGSWLKVSVSKGIAYVSQPCFVPLRSAEKPQTQQTRSNAEGFFEITMELPKGMTQMAVNVATPAKAHKTFLLSVDVNPAKEDIQLSNTKVSKAKPPAAAKRVRLWAGAGFTYQFYNQTTTGSTDLNFQTVQAPGFVLRGGYWGEQWGLDLYFRDAPGKIQADAPLTLQTDTYHWQTTDIKGLYQFERGPSSRLLGLPSQWQLRFGAEFHQIPFMEISNTNVIGVSDNRLTMAMLGLGLLLGQEQDWTYEMAFGVQSPIAASSTQGRSFAVSSPFGYEMQLGAAYKFAPNWRLGLFSYTQSLVYTYEYQSNTGVRKDGKQSLFYTTFDLRLGYEF